MNRENSSLQSRIDRTTAKLAALKAQQQAREAREKTRHYRAARAMRNRALVLWGVALERAALAAPDDTTPHGLGGSSKIRALLERHLTRENERAAALDFLNALECAAPSQSAVASNQNGAGLQ
ncbi:MAG: hypothetical protein KGJ32_02035 [Xanthomonadaceae bacterium]|nr:hypothetical protein [Xanthomonadaceae bacterium]